MCALPFIERVLVNGAGGNHAMLDGIKLGALLASSRSLTDIPDLLKGFEEEMLARTRKEQDSSRATTFGMHRSYEEWKGRGEQGIEDTKDKTVPEWNNIYHSPVYKRI